MDIGFTGTQGGVTERQEGALFKVLSSLRSKGAEWLHNGDCVGADAVAFELWNALGGLSMGHIPLVDAKRAFCKHDAEFEEPKPYLDRNHDIVDNSTVLIACPGNMAEQVRSGTWATVRYAKKNSKKIIIIYPDGTMQRWD